MNLKDLVKDNFVRFESFRQGNFYYTLRKVQESTMGWTEEEYVDYQFTVPLEDIGTATLLREDKAITFMRWIRKAVEENTLIRV